MGSTRGERRKGRGGSGAGLMDAWWRGRGIGVGVRATRHPEVKDISCTAARGLSTCGWGSRGTHTVSVVFVVRCTRARARVRSLIVAVPSRVSNRSWSRSALRRVTLSFMTRFSRRECRETYPQLFDRAAGLWIVGLFSNRARGSGLVAGVLFVALYPVPDVLLPGAASGHSRTEVTPWQISVSLTTS